MLRERLLISVSSGGGTEFLNQGKPFASRVQTGSNSSGVKFILYYPEGVIIGRKVPEDSCKEKGKRC